MQVCEATKALQQCQLVTCDGGSQPGNNAYVIVEFYCLQLLQFAVYKRQQQLALACGAVI